MATAARSLGKQRKITFRLLLPLVLGLPPDEPALDLAADRFEDFVRALPDDVADDMRLLLNAVNWLSFFVYGRFPSLLSDGELADYVERLTDPEHEWPANPLRVLRKIFGHGVPSVLDLFRALREACTLAWYGTEESNAWTGFVPLWERPEVLEADPESATAAPYTRKNRSRLDVAALRAKRAHTTRKSGFFAEDGRPRVAIVGAGPAGAIVASVLAKDCDVAIFEAGPELSVREYAVDSMAAMALMYEKGLLYPSSDLDLRVLQARVVGGGSAVNEGVSVRPRGSTLDHWARMGATLDRGELNRGLDVAEKRQRFEPYARDRMTDPSLRFERGAKARRGVDVATLASDLATNASQHDGTMDDVIGERCLGCGYCNHGCRFGHHLSVDRTFLRDARAAGARVWANTPVSHVVTARGPGVSVSGIRLDRRTRDTIVHADAVVLAAGALGSPALMVRSVGRSAKLRCLPANLAGHFGGGLGFNYGTPVVARWNDALPRPGYDGLQVAFVATKAGDEAFILENGFLPPGVMAPVVPGVGPEHLRWMRAFGRLGMCVNTIGGHNDGKVGADGGVKYRIGEDAMGTIHESLATMIDIYLHADAGEVGLSGLLRVDGVPHTFGPESKGDVRGIVERLRRLAPSVENLALASGHPQGGLCLNDRPEDGAVGPDFRVHGVDNLFVADASLFPTTITVNVQWLVMGLAWSAARAIREQVVGPAVQARSSRLAVV